MMPVDSAPPRARKVGWTGHRERGSAGLLKLMASFSLLVGRRWSRLPLYGIALYFFCFAPRARRCSREYLRRALAREPRAGERLRHLLTFATTIHDRVFMAAHRDEALHITVEGEALMHRQLALGQGAFLMGAHLGSFEVIGSFGRSQPGLRLSMATYEENARKLAATLAALHPDAAPEIISLGHLDAMLRIAERLDAGVFVGMLADRTLGAEPVQEVALLGARALLPTGPMRAAALLRRPVIFMAGFYLGDNRYHIVFETLADFTQVTAAARGPAVRVAVERYAALLDRYCREHPYNWFNFFDFWAVSDARPAA